MQERTAIYLDANAALPPSSELICKLKECMSEAAVFANASSVHSFGRYAHSSLSKALTAIAQSLGARTQDLVLTSSGTEALQSVLKPVAFRALRGHAASPVWITVDGAHAALRECENWFTQLGGIVYKIKIDGDGQPQFDPKDLTAFLLKSSVTPAEIALISLLWVNNETGIVTDVRSILSEIRAVLSRIANAESSNPFVLLDGCQAWGKLPISVELLSQWGVHGLGLSAAKVGGLLGTGVFWLNPSKKNVFEPLFIGSQQRGRRGGSENVIGAIALGIACTEINSTLHLTKVTKISHSRDVLQASLLEVFPDLIIRGKNSLRVGNTLNIGFPEITQPGLVQILDSMGIAVSAGSACSSGIEEPSATLLAMGVPENLARSAIRISLAEPLENHEIQVIVNSITDAVKRFRPKKN